MSAPGGGLESALPLLACPHCSQDLGLTARGVVGCPTGHRFDIARRGYLSLLGSRSRTDTGDSADMVAARVAFLAAQHYRPIAEAIAGQIDAGPVLDIGAGTGYYLAAVLEKLTEPGGGPVGVALDASRYAAGRSAAAHPDIGSVVADAWSRLPVRDKVANAVLSVFAPRDPVEISRVLAPGGRVVVVTPEPDHLSEIREDLQLLTVDPGKPDRLETAFSGRLVTTERIPLRCEMPLTRDDVDALVRMGPSARHLRTGELDRAVSSLPEVSIVTLAVTISVLQPV
jgi:23S rRNA (guanine745-N1)-methyltransferase